MPSTDPHTTITGRLTADPDVTRTSSERCRAQLRLAVNRRRRVAGTDEWEDARAEFFTVVCWGDLAVRAGQTLRKGDRVVAAGRLQHREYEVQQGVGEDARTERRSVVEVVADELGPSLRWDTWQKVEPRAMRDPARGRAPHPAVQTADVADGPAPGDPDPTDPTDPDVAAAA